MSTGSITNLLLIALGGALGALLRYVVSGWFYAALGDVFPWGTLAANLAGCFLIGLFWAVGEHVPLAPATRVFVFTGVLGAFTTFSTYSLESINLMCDDHVWRGLANVLVSNLGGLLLAYLGILAARAFFEAGG